MSTSQSTSAALAYVFDSIAVRPIWPILLDPSLTAGVEDADLETAEQVARVRGVHVERVWGTLDALVVAQSELARWDADEAALATRALHVIFLALLPIDFGTADAAVAGVVDRFRELASADAEARSWVLSPTPSQRAMSDAVRHTDRLAALAALLFEDPPESDEVLAGRRRCVEVALRSLRDGRGWRALAREMNTSVDVARKFGFSVAAALKALHPQPATND